MSGRGRPEERTSEAEGAASTAPFGTSSPEWDPSPFSTAGAEPSGRSWGSTVAVILAALALTVSLGTWFRVQEESPVPARSTDAVGTEDRAGDDSPTAVVSPSSEFDYVIDLHTGETTPLALAIVRSLGSDGHFPSDSPGHYAASPDGSRLAYVGTGDDGSFQIFVSGIDGTGLRQMTHHPTGAISPAWSPDGTRLVYESRGRRDVQNIFVLDMATGESTQVTDEPLPCGGCSAPVFTSDGSSLIYTGGTSSNPVLRTVPVTGGKSTLLFDRRAQGLGATGGGSLSPDGSLLTFMGHEIGGPGALRFVANADGTDWRIIPRCYGSNPAGTWSPDGNRIVCLGSREEGIKVVDIVTGDATRVAKGQGAIWLDDHTLLVEA
jgi:Tol biopolymer transport system component